MEEFDEDDYNDVSVFFLFHHSLTRTSSSSILMLRSPKNKQKKPEIKNFLTSKIKEDPKRTKQAEISFVVVVKSISLILLCILISKQNMAEHNLMEQKLIMLALEKQEEDLKKLIQEQMRIEQFQIEMLLSV
jgi:hypothetical protein